MILAVGIIIFIIGCCLSTYERNTFSSQQRAEQRHEELMKALSEAGRSNSSPAKRKQTRRRFAVDREGNLLGEEITEEDLE